MPGLAEQKLIIDGLERAVAVHRVRLIEAVRTLDPPANTVMVTAGTVLIVADLVPTVRAAAGLFFGDPTPGDRRKCLLKVFLEAPLLMRSVRRLLPNRKHTPFLRRRTPFLRHLK